jgi:hypothetical protein
MTVMQRLVNKTASYAAEQLAAAFKDRLNPFGGERGWERGKSDWHLMGGVVPYPCSDADLVKNFLSAAVGGVIVELEAALVKAPGEKVTFYHIPNESLWKYGQFFRDKDYSAEAFCGDVCALAHGSYINGKRRVFLSLLCTPLSGRAANVEILEEAANVS